MAERERRAGSAASESNELLELRARVDSLDDRIVALLNERARLNVAIGRAKAAAGRRAIRDYRREREVLEHVAGANGGPLPDEELLAVYRRLMAASRRLQASLDGDDPRIRDQADPGGAGR